MSDLLVTPRGTSRAAAAAAALTSGFIIAERVRPYVEQGVSTLKRAYSALRDQSQVRYGPGSGRYRREQQLAQKRYRRERESVKRKLDFEETKTTLKVPSYSKSSSMSNSVQFTRYSDRIGQKRRRNSKQMFDASIGRMNELIFRWQQVSPSLLGPGENVLAYGSDPTTPTQFVCPVVIASLTSQLLGEINQDFGTQKTGLNRITYNSTTRAFGYQKLSTQNNLGNYVGAEWQYESGGTKAANFTADPTMFHKWTDIRLNLYGSAYYPLTYEILVVTGMATDMSLFDFAAGGSPIFEETNFNAWLRDHCKDYIGNPIVGSNIDRTDLKGKVRVLRRRIVKIEPLSYGDAQAQQADVNVGMDASNVKNINMFIRHDRFRRYGWTPSDTDMQQQTLLDGTGYDKTATNLQVSASMLSDVDREERVYLIIKCTAPRLLSAAEFNTAAAVAPVAELSQSLVPPFSGSYDIVMRNCFRYDYVA